MCSSASCNCCTQYYYCCGRLMWMRMGTFIPNWHLPPNQNKRHSHDSLALSLFASFTGIGHASNRTRFVLCTGACITNKTAIVSALAHTHARARKHLWNKCALSAPVWPSRLTEPSIRLLHSAHTQHAKSNLFVIFHFYYNKFHSNTIKSIRERTEERKAEWVLFVQTTLKNGNQLKTNL